MIILPRCPKCGREAEDFGSFIGCPSCGPVELPANKPLLPTTSPPTPPVQSKPPFSPPSVQPPPTKASHIGKETSGNLRVVIGRVLKSPSSGDLSCRVSAEFPSQLRGRQVLIDCSNYLEVYQVGRFVRTRPLSPQIKKGDLVIIAYSADSKGIFYKNLTVDIQGPLINRLERGWWGFGPLEAKDDPIADVGKRAIETFESEISEERDARGFLETNHKAEAYSFECLVATLFEKKGAQNVALVGGAGDKGVDIRGFFPNRGKFIVQCKHQSTKNKVTPAQVREFAHVIEHEKKTEGIVSGFFVTSSYFSPECFFPENKEGDMMLVDRDELEKDLREYGLTEYLKLFCRYCGSPVATGDAFCSNCRRALV